MEEFIPEVDTEFKNARSLSINLRKVTATAVKLEFYFASKWIMISEITFDSGKNR